MPAHQIPNQRRVAESLTIPTRDLPYARSAAEADVFAPDRRLSVVTDTPRLNRKIFIYHADIEGDKQDVVSIVDHDWVFRNGLCAEAILGSLRPPVAGERGITPERFDPTPHSCSSCTR
jgi:hypothetical protein